MLGFTTGRLAGLCFRAIAYLLLLLTGGNALAASGPVTTGSLVVTLNPPAAVAAGAQWRRLGTTAWHDNMTTESGITSGTYAVEFKPLSFWKPPTNKNVSVQGGQVAQTTGTYTAAGLLRVTVTPPEAAASGVQWRRLGTSTWFNSGTSETVGGGPTILTLEFKASATYSIASVQQATVTSGQVTDSTAPCVQLQNGISWSTYLGGSQYDYGNGVAFDSAGNILVTGKTASPGWVSGGLDTVQSSGVDTAYLVKLAPDGRHLWSTYIGGGYYDSGNAVATDADDNIYVAGMTSLSGWAFGGADPIFHGNQDGFLVKLSPEGQHLWSTYLGGTGIEQALGVAVQGSNVYVTGYTTSVYPWTQGGYDATFNGGAQDAFVARFTTSGALVWSTLLGGSGNDTAHSIAITPSGNPVLCGETTTSSGLASGNFAPSYGGAQDAYVMMLDPDSHPLWLRYLGGAGNEYGYSVAVDRDGNIFVAGSSSSGGWVSGGYNTVLGGNSDGFVARLSPEGQPVWSSYFGGSGTDNCYSLALDAAGNVNVGGWTLSRGWTYGGFCTASSGGAFIVQLTPTGQHRWSAVFGGNSNDHVYGLAADRWGNLCATGYTSRTTLNNWASGGYDTTPHSSSSISDGFLVKIHAQGGTLRLDLTPPEAVAAGAGWRPVGSSTWLASGGTTTPLTSDPLQIEFKPVPGWAEPQRQFVGVGTGLTTATFAYVHWGSLRVTLQPSDAVAAGAQWRRLGTTPWLNSGDLETSVPARKDYIELKPVADWLQPSRIPVSILENQVTNTLASYAPVPGSLQVSILPSKAINRGARWRRVGQTAWLMGSAIETNITPGSYTIEFNPVTGWDTPSTLTLTVRSNQTVTTQVIYIQQVGSLRVGITPPEAVSAGAQWRRVGTTPWFDCNATETDLLTGDYDVEFKDISNWARPANKTVTINGYQLTTATVVYGPPGCWLKLTLGPSQAITAGAAWRRVGQANWLPSGATEGIGAPGTYQVEFKPLTDWIAPSSYTWVTIKAGETLACNFNYVSLRVGNLRVMIYPPEAVTAGAQWRFVGTTTWRDSGYTEAAIPIGESVVEFKPVPGWVAPQNQKVPIMENIWFTYGIEYTRPTAIAPSLWGLYE